MYVLRFSCQTFSDIYGTSLISIAQILAALYWHASRHAAARNFCNIIPEKCLIVKITVGSTAVILKFKNTEMLTELFLKFRNATIPESQLKSNTAKTEAQNQTEHLAICI